MHIGKQIKALRLRRGVTQEAMAQHFGITAQAVSKWETEQSVPDIGMLPELSAYFGVSIDELFALSDEIRIERIQNMIWDVRFLNPADVENERQFLLEKARREPRNGDPHCMLAQLELHLAKEHCIRAEEYALEIITRDNGAGVGCVYLAKAMGGARIDPRHNSHPALIAHYKDCLQKYPDDMEVYGALITQLIDDHRLAEAKVYCARMEAAHGNLQSIRQSWRLHRVIQKPPELCGQNWIANTPITGVFSIGSGTCKRWQESIPPPRNTTRSRLR